jgi:hypothetical protein
MATANSGKFRQRVRLLAVQGAAVLVAAAFLAVAIAGFTPGLTTHLDRLQWLGHDSESQLFGVFEVSVVHNLLHLAFGVAGLLLAGTYARARAFLVGGSLIYLGLWLYGLLTEPSGPRNVLPLNDADNWLHFSIGVVMILLGLTLAGARVPTGAGGEPLIDPD